jgi:hypothetical protein
MIPDFQRKVAVWYMLMRIFTALGHRNVSHVNAHECAMSTVLHVLPHYQLVYVQLQQGLRASGNTSWLEWLQQ